MLNIFNRLFKAIIDIQSILALRFRVSKEVMF